MTLDPAFLKELEAHAIAISRGAGEILLEHFAQPLEVEFKSQGHEDPVTLVDRKAEEYIREGVRRRFPDHHVLGEEGDEDPAGLPEFLWVVDPLDGTTNYVSGLPLFGVSLAVLYRATPVVGCIYAPLGHRAQAGMYHCCQGGGAFFQDQPLHVAKDDAEAQPRIVALPAGFGGRFRFSGPLARSPSEARVLGSVALEMALVTSGVLRFAFFGGPRIWDVAAGILLVQEAGGLALVRQHRGGDWHPFETFEIPSRARSKDRTPSLRDWAASVVVGPPEAARSVVAHLRTRGGPLLWLRALLRRWRGSAGLTTGRARGESRSEPNPPSPTAPPQA